MGDIGLSKLIFIFVIALLVFGPKRLPELGRSLGKGLAELKRATNGVRESIKRELENAELENLIRDKPKTPEAGSNRNAPKS